MAGIDDVIALLEDLRGAQGVVSRGVVLAQGARALRELTPRQRRELAVQVAERAAPQLLPRIEAETGADLTPAQVRAVLDLALRLDDGQIDDLLATLRTAPPGERASAAESEPAAEAVPTAGTVEDDPVLDELQAELEQQRREVAELEQQARVTVERAAKAAAAPIDPAPPPGAGPPTDRAPTAGPADPPEPPEPPEPADRPEPAEPPGPAPSVPVPDAPPRPPLPAGADEPAQVAATAPPLDAARGRAQVDAVRHAGSIRAQLAVVGAAGAALRDAGPAGRRELLESIPDGWGRRRALERMAEADVVTGDEALGLLRSLRRGSDRAWAAGTLLAHGVVDTAQLVGTVPTRALGRLERRHP